MARKSGFVRRHGVMRRETMWLTNPYATSSIGAGSTAVLAAALNAAALALRPFTIVRVRGHFHVRSDQTAASETWGCSMGYAVVSDQASAIGVTAVPTPEADRDSDLFFVYESMIGRFAISSAASFVDVGRGVDFDSKAMRKVEQGQDMVITVETPSVVSSGVITDGSRILIKLH